VKAVGREKERKNKLYLNFSKIVEKYILIYNKSKDHIILVLVWSQILIY
jgi:hypothetical protein